jgi:hypothetical protein
MENTPQHPGQLRARQDHLYIIIDKYYPGMAGGIFDFHG